MTTIVCQDLLSAGTRNEHKTALSSPDGHGKSSKLASMKDKGQFEVEANVEPQFVDELYPDQPTMLRFSAFNQRTTPEVSGKVKGISANVVVNENTGQSFYKVRISVPPEELARLGGQPLVPGMPVEAFVKTREQTALNYLLKPLSDQINRAFREE